MSDTPETDAQAYDVGGYQHEDGSIVLSAFARKLERERDEYRGLLIELYNDLNIIHSGNAVRKLSKMFREENYN